MRTFLVGMAVLLLPATLLAGPPSSCCCKDKGCCGMGQEGSKAAVREKVDSGVAGGITAGEHAAIFDLLSQHANLKRKVEEIPNGVKTTTTSDKPELTELIRTHARQMAKRLEEGRGVRLWDPVFRGVFVHHNEIKIELRDVAGGIEVTETSEDPAVVTVIRAHAAKVTSFVEGGHAAARPPWAGPGRGRMGMGPGAGMGMGPGAGMGMGRGMGAGPGRGMMGRGMGMRHGWNR